MFQSPFSFNGRIRRSEFGFSVIIYAVFYVLLLSIMGPESEKTGFLGIIFIPMVWFIWAQAAKRCHDLGKSGFWQLIPFYFLWLLFQDGQFFENEYGENPKGINTSQFSAIYQNPPSVTTQEESIKLNSSNIHIDLTKKSDV